MKLFVALAAHPDSDGQRESALQGQASYIVLHSTGDSPVQDVIITSQVFNHDLNLFCEFQ